MHTNAEDPSGSRLTPIVLDLVDISKTFGRVEVLRGVGFELRYGELHALMGENGAGKSTLVRIIGGIIQPDPGGVIWINGSRTVLSSPQAALAAGIVIIHQELSLAENLTVSENIFMGREIRRGPLIDRAGMRKACGVILRELGAQFDADTVVRHLTLGERQLVEVARAVQSGASVIVMDEPTTALSSREVERLFGIIRKLRTQGVSIVYISHRMDEVFALADRATVLRDGQYVGTLEGSDLQPERLVKMMVGRELSSLYQRKKRQNQPGAPILVANDISDGKAIGPCSMSLYQGEVLGIGGLIGSGRTELARLLAGIDRQARGVVSVVQYDRPVKTIQDAQEAGIAYLTEDRKGLGLFLQMDVRDNINFLRAPDDAFGGTIRNFRRERQRSTTSISNLSIRLPNDRVAIGRLSGGNQQKALLARLLETGPRVVILDEPTRGIDLGAKAQIYEIVDGLVRRGVGVIVISSELTELIGIADRVLVMREGKLVGEVGYRNGKDITEEAIMLLAAGLGEEVGKKAEAGVVV